MNQSVHQPQEPGQPPAAVDQSVNRSSQAFNAARGAAASRCVENADVAATKFSFALSDIRKSEVGSSALPRLASITLDDFVGNSRTAADICAHTTNAQSDRERIEHSIAELNGMFADDLKAMEELRIQPSSFMPDAEQMSSSIQRDLHALHSEFERVHQGLPQGLANTARPGQVIERERQQH